MVRILSIIVGFRTEELWIWERLRQRSQKLLAFLRQISSFSGFTPLLPFVPKVSKFQTILSNIAMISELTGLRIFARN